MLTRRDFLRACGLSLGGVALMRFAPLSAYGIAPVAIAVPAAAAAVGVDATAMLTSFAGICTAVLGCSLAAYVGAKEGTAIADWTQEQTDKAVQLFEHWQKRGLTSPNLLDHTATYDQDGHRVTWGEVLEKAGLLDKWQDSDPGGGGSGGGGGGNKKPKLDDFKDGDTPADKITAFKNFVICAGIMAGGQIGVSLLNMAAGSLFDALFDDGMLVSGLEYNGYPELTMGDTTIAVGPRDEQEYNDLYNIEVSGAMGIQGQAVVQYSPPSGMPYIAFYYWADSGWKSRTASDGSLIVYTTGFSYATYLSVGYKNPGFTEIKHSDAYIERGLSSAYRVSYATAKALDPSYNAPSKPVSSTTYPYPSTSVPEYAQNNVKELADIAQRNKDAGTDYHDDEEYQRKFGAYVQSNLPFNSVNDANKYVAYQSPIVVNEGHQVVTNPSVNAEPGTSAETIANTYPDVVTTTNTRPAYVQENPWGSVTLPDGYSFPTSWQNSGMSVMQLWPLCYLNDFNNLLWKSFPGGVDTYYPKVTIKGLPTSYPDASGMYQTSDMVIDFAFLEPYNPLIRFIEGTGIILGSIYLAYKIWSHNLGTDGGKG